MSGFFLFPLVIFFRLPLISVSQIRYILLRLFPGFRVALRLHGMTEMEALR